MSVSESEDSEPLVYSQILGPVRNALRVNLLRSPAPSEGQDSDVGEEGLIAPVRLGHLQRVDLLRSPSQSEGQDSDATEDGLTAPVESGNQQQISGESSNREESGAERSAQINLDIELRPTSALTSNDPGHSSRPSVIFTGATSSNVPAVQNVDDESVHPHEENEGERPDYSDGIIMMTSPQLHYEDNYEPMQDEVPNAPSGTIPVSVVIHRLEDNVAGPSNRPDSVVPLIPYEVTSEHHSAQDEDAIIPVLINNPPAHSMPGTATPTNEASSSQNVDSTLEERALGESGPPVAEAVAVEAPSTSGPTDQGREESAPPCKRQRLNDSPVAPPVVDPPKPPVIDDDEDDGLTCTICLDHWTSSGEHRLISLKCGHLFGFCCIERWLKNQKVPERRCPTCKTRAKMTDVRNLYGHRVQMIDTSELEELRGKTKQLEHAKLDLEREVGSLQKQTHELQVKHREALQEIQKLKTEKLIQRPSKRTSSSPQIKYRASLVQTLELSKNEGCRVIAFNEVRCLIAASVPSPTNLFKEYALKLIDAESFRPRQTMPSHNRMIRDVAFSNDGKLLLSCSLDRTANVLDMDSNTSLATFQSDLPIWSVCWDADNPWLLFTGAQNGVVQQFDVRSPGQELSRIVMEGSPTPVASLAGIPKTSSAGWLQGGFISCRFRHLCPYERTDDGFRHHPWAMDGLFTSLRYEKRTEHILVSTRPTEKSPRAQHMLFQMSALGNVPQYNLVQNFFGSTTSGVISRSCVMPMMSPQGEVEDLLVSSYVESEAHVGLWSCSVGQKLQNIQSSEIIMDLCPIYANGKNYLSTLSDKKIRLYKVEKS